MLTPKSHGAPKQRIISKRKVKRCLGLTSLGLTALNRASKPQDEEAAKP